jgi:DNA-binding NarL/FixJ family response regulator
MTEFLLTEGVPGGAPSPTRFGPVAVSPANPVPASPVPVGRAGQHSATAATTNPAPARVIRVLVIDSHPVTRWGLGRVTAEQPDLALVGEAGTAAEALRLVAALRPDVVTVGLSLPDRDGLELVRELRDHDDRLGLVVLTSQSEDDVLFRALDTGASAFVSKAASLPEVLGAIRHAAVSASSFSAAGLAQAMHRRTERQARRPLLSAREAQVLGLLQEGKSVPEVAEAMFVSLSTAKTYVSRLYDKLGVTNRAQAMMAAVRLNLTSSPVAAVERSQLHFS